jgi:hypothetical protein
MATTVTLKPNAIDISGSTSGTTTLQATAVAGTTTITLPAATDTLVGKATTDTLTNKTLTTPVISSLSSASATALTLQSAGTTAITVDTSQKVGIGTASPSQLLHVNSAGAAIALIQSTLVAGNTNVETRYTSTNRSWGVGQNIIQTSSVFEVADITASATRLAIDSSGNVGIGTSSPTATGGYDKALDVVGGANGAGLYVRGSTNPSTVYGAIQYDNGSNRTNINAIGTSNFLRFVTVDTERMRISSSGQLLVGTTSVALNNNGLKYEGSNGALLLSRTGDTPFAINRITNDGTLIDFYQDTVSEGTISVSGTTVSYNGGHLSRYAQTTIAKDESLVKGTVLSNLDAMNVYTAPTTYWTEEDELPEGVNIGDVKVETHEVANEQLNKVKVSDVEGDANVAGVFVNWTYDKAHQVDEINMAMTGDMIIRIAQGVTVQRGDLLMSAGDGTAKAQGDDIVRSKTIAKVTSNHVTCTYADGSYCVPCVLMAC